MSTTEDDIQEFLETEFDKLKGYFGRDDEKTENEIVERAISEKFRFSVEEDPRGYDKRYSVKINVDGSCIPTLSGQLVRNRSRIESNLLSAIKKLISEKRLVSD